MLTVALKRRACQVHAMTWTFAQPEGCWLAEHDNPFAPWPKAMGRPTWAYCTGECPHLSSSSSSTACIANGFAVSRADWALTCVWMQCTSCSTLWHKVITRPRGARLGLAAPASPTYHIHQRAVLCLAMGRGRGADMYTHRGARVHSLACSRCTHSGTHLYMPDKPRWGTQQQPPRAVLASRAQ